MHSSNENLSLLLLFASYMHPCLTGTLSLVGFEKFCITPSVLRTLCVSCGPGSAHPCP